MRTWRLVKWGSVYVWPPACVRSFFLWNQVKKHLPSLSVNDTIHLGSDCWFKTSSPSTPSQTLLSAPDLLPWTSHLHDDCKLLHLISYSKLSNPLCLYGLHYTYTCLHPPELHVFRLWWGCVFFSYSSDLYPVRQNKEDLTYSSSTTWIAYNSTAILTWQIIRSKGPILHYPHNKALPVGPTHVATKLEHCAMYSISLFHSFSLKSISDMGGSVSTSESYLTVISNKAFKYVHNVWAMA